MSQKTKDPLPWNINIVLNSYYRNEYTVEPKIRFDDIQLREKMKKVSDTYFSVSFKTYWFKKGIKSARVYRSDRRTKISQRYSSRMKFTFFDPDEATLFAQGIERALDNFIMEKMLEDKQF